MGTAAKIARRTFLIGMATIGGGAAFGIYAYRRDPGNPLLDGLGPDEATLTPYVLLDAEGVTLITPRADVGQGAASIQAHLLAEELDVDPLTVRLSPGPASAVYHNGKVAAEGMPLAAWDEGLLARTGRAASDVAGKLVGLHLTGGSTTVPDTYERAARGRGLGPRDVESGGGGAAGPVRSGSAHRGGPRDLGRGRAVLFRPDPGFGRGRDRAGCRAARPLAVAPSGQASSPHRYRREVSRHLSLWRRSGAAGHDPRNGRDQPDPGWGRRLDGRVRGAGDARRRGCAADHRWAAVLADNDWRAITAARSIVFEWGGSGAHSDDLWPLHEAALDGDRDSAFTDEGGCRRRPGQRFEAQYRVPFLHHAPLEPANATVRYTEDATEVWTATQAPILLARAVAKVTGQDADHVTVHALPAGGSFGHRLEHDWALQAAEIAMQVPGRPVRLTLSREEDMTHGFYRPMAVARGHGTVDGGQVRSLDLAIAAQSVSESQMGRQGYPSLGPDVAIVAGAWDAPYALPDRRVTGHRVARNGARQFLAGSRRLA